jgi:hypothetical protein
MQEELFSEKPKRERQARTRDVHLRLTEDEYEVFNDRAEREGLSLSGLIRQCTRRALGMTPKKH